MIVFARISALLVEHRTRRRQLPHCSIFSNFDLKLAHFKNLISNNVTDLHGNTCEQIQTHMKVVLIIVGSSEFSMTTHCCETIFSLKLQCRSFLLDRQNKYFFFTKK